MWQRMPAVLVLAILLTAQAPLPQPAPPQPPRPSEPQAKQPNPIADLEVVELQSAGAGGATIKAYLRRPAPAAPGGKVPAVIAVHGCGGLFNNKGDLIIRERDWLGRFNAAGYAVIYPDSFNPRGFREVCSLSTSQRTIFPRQRAEDVAATLAWLQTAPGIDPARIALVGWSHGGSTTLWSAAKGFRAAAGLKTAIAFYPGCRVPGQSQTWAPGMPLTILIGDEDDWTPVGPCRNLVARYPDVRMIEYPGAVHGFDAPNSPRRTRANVGSTPTGTAQIGTDPKARAAAIDEVMRLLAAAFK